MPGSKSKSKKVKPSAKRSSANGNRLYDLGQIAKLIGGKVVGNKTTRITGICGIREAKAGDLTFVANSKYTYLIGQTRASAVIASKDVQSAKKPIIQTENPSLAFSKLVSLFVPATQQHPKGVSSQALIGEGVKLGKGVAVQAFAIIEDGVQIGDRSVIYGGTTVGRETRIGKDCLIYPNVAIRENVEIGHRVIVHSGTVIGSDGFGFATVKGIHHKIPQIGTVVIEDDVEIGANVTIDRARFGKTVVGKGTKVDNLVQIAHNVETGSNCILVAQSGISGSTQLGHNVVLAGQSGVVGHVSIGDNVIAGAQSGISKSVPANTNVWGTPAKPLAKAKRVNAVLQSLPELYKEVETLRKKVAELESHVGKKSSKR